ncbi:hypothetical protein NDU88_002512 [Pleurodeles waltl]|uniref:Uncharacterized protein n=1 Tax=Pleurodeles waltl TaxID=8319 RepID=A0AAV7TM69_PLEWA|nr:hypothetical protein NDU88_002512 [Pleurodeles waltl]
MKEKRHCLLRDFIVTGDLAYGAKEEPSRRLDYHQESEDAASEELGPTAEDADDQNTGFEGERHQLSYTDPGMVWISLGDNGADDETEQWENLFVMGQVQDSGSALTVGRRNILFCRWYSKKYKQCNNY